MRVEVIVGFVTLRIYSCWLDARMVSDEEDVVPRAKKERRNPSHVIPTLVRRALCLVFLQIFTGYVILRNLMRTNLPLISVPSLFHARHYIGLERVSFLDQLVDTLRIRTFDVGQSL